MGVGPTIDRLLKDYKGKIRLVIKHYPYKYRDFSHIAAEAAMAAHEQKRFEDMHRMLLSRSPKLDKESLIKYARELGLDVKAFTDINDPGVTATVRFVAKIYHYEEYLKLKEDPGRFLITRDKKDWKAFRTPTLREISRTAPYMHNGVFKTLDEVIEFFNRGGGEGNKILRPLNLTEEEKRYLKAFLIEALRGEEIKIKMPEIP